jgi:hypothetical protein
LSRVEKNKKLGEEEKTRGKRGSSAGGCVQIVVGDGRDGSQLANSGEKGGGGVNNDGIFDGWRRVVVGVFSSGLGQGRVERTS